MDNAPPLEGYRVVDIGPRIASAFAAKHLAEMGAEVLRIESPGPDLVRAMPPVLGEPSEECGALHLYVNGGKRSLALDYSSGRGRDVLDGLLARADIVVNGHTPRESDALGLTEERLAALNPNALLVSVSSFGRSGPYRDFEGSDILLLALGGFMYACGDPDREPLAPFGHVGEYQLGFNALIAALGLLFGRETAGLAQSADVAGMETAASILENSLGIYMADGTVRMRAGNGFYTGTPAVAVYECKDGFISIALSGEHHWTGLCTVMERFDWLEDPTLQDWPARARRGEEIAAAIADWCAQRTRSQVFETFQTFRMPAAPGYSLAEVLADPQHADRRYFVPVDSAAGPFVTPRLPFITTAYEGRDGPPPRLGEHSRDALRDWLGLSDGEIGRLVEEAVVYPWGAA